MKLQDKPHTVDMLVALVCAVIAALSITAAVRDWI